MTKKDQKAVVLGTAVGLGLFAAIFYFARKTQTIPVLSPSLIKWDVVT